MLLLIQECCVFIVGYINKNKLIITEGELRINGLNKYLENLNLEKYVWLSEDATGIVTKVEFDPKSNQMIGLVLPTDPVSGIPIAYTYLASNEEEINKNIKCAKSTHVYFVMAQPILKNVPPYILQIFGNDNKFTTQNVLSRWKHTVAELHR